MLKVLALIEKSIEVARDMEAGGNHLNAVAALEILLRDVERAVELRETP